MSETASEPKPGTVKGFFLKVFFGFWILWIIWYVTGGPYRDDKTKPFMGFNQETGALETLGTTTSSH